MVLEVHGVRVGPGTSGLWVSTRSGNRTTWMRPRPGARLHTLFQWQPSTRTGTRPNGLDSQRTVLHVISRVRCVPTYTALRGRSSPLGLFFSLLPLVPLFLSSSLPFTLLLNPISSNLFESVYRWPSPLSRLRSQRTVSRVMRRVRCLSTHHTALRGRSSPLGLFIFFPLPSNPIYSIYGG